MSLLAHVLVGSCPCWLVAWLFVVRCSSNKVNIQCHLRLPCVQDSQLESGKFGNECDVRRSDLDHVVDGFLGHNRGSETTSVSTAL